MTELVYLPDGLVAEIQIRVAALVEPEAPNEAPYLAEFREPSFPDVLRSCAALTSGQIADERERLHLLAPPAALLEAAFRKVINMGIPE